MALVLAVLTVEGVKMTGIEKKTIKNITFNLPMTPLEVGY